MVLQYGKVNSGGGEVWGSVGKPISTGNTFLAFILQKKTLNIDLGTYKN